MKVGKVLAALILVMIVAVAGAGDPPNSTFTPTGEVTGCDPKSVTFTDTSTNTPTAWVWNATNVTGNNTMFTFSTLQNPVHSFGIGNFTINLTSENAFGANESWQVSWINVSGACAPVTPVPIYGVSDIGVDAPLAPVVPALGTIVAMIILNRRRKRTWTKMK
jgi:PKD repeat protein